MHGDAQGKFSQWYIRVTEPIIFGNRPRTLLVLFLMTLFMGWHASKLRPDAGFEKQLPLGHPYIQVFKQYQRDFGGANLVLFALVQKKGDIYTAEYMDTLRKATDEVFFLPGIDRARVSSLFTPDVRFIEVVEGGFAGGNIIPANYQPTPEMLDRVHSNVQKSQYVGRLVANDHTGAMIFSELLDFDPLTGKKLNYARTAHKLEDLRGQFTNPKMFEYRLKSEFGSHKAGDLVLKGFQKIDWMPLHTFEVRSQGEDGLELIEEISGSDLDATEVANPDYNPNIDMHIIGFAKVVGDVSEATVEVVGFFGLTLLITLALLWLYCGSLRVALLPLSCAVLAVVWELGLLQLFGYGLDPFAILVPFLVVSISVSHGVQITSFWLFEIAEHGRNSFDASRATYRRLVIPGITALLTNVIGFGTILLIPIAIIQEMAVNAMFGLVAVIVCKKILLPCLLTYAPLDNPEKFREHQRRRDAMFDPMWKVLSKITEKKPAALVLLGAVGVLAWSLWMGQFLKIGELHEGVPELRPESRYNRDSAAVIRKFSIGVDVLKVIAEAPAEGCINSTAMNMIDDYAWRMSNTAGVQSVLSLPQAARIVFMNFSEGSPKWKVLSRNSDILVQSITPFPTSTGLLNQDCSAMPVFIFTADHKAETIDHIIAETHRYIAELPANAPVKFALATGNVGVMAAVNDVIKETERPILFWLFLCIGVCIWASFRSMAALLCILVPLGIVSWLSYAVMVMLEIGVKVSTLPVAAFAAGIGVDYGIYIYSVLEECVMDKGMPLRQAYEQTLHQTGKAVVFTALTLAGSVCTWMLSGLQFQVDMGILLTVMFLANAVAAVLILPAFAAFLLNKPAAAPNAGA